MNRIFREPLLHFLVLGAALFALYGWLNRAGFDAPNEIVVSRGQVESLSAQFERVWQRAPTPQEKQGLIDGWVREEILYREGLAMGLDRDDPVVRRRISQKVQFIVEGTTAEAPSAEELQRWLDQHREDYRVESTYSLRQVYFDPTRHGERLEDTVAAVRRALEGGESVAGDPTLLPGAMSAGAAEIARTFGGGFEHALRTVSIGSWQGPVRSGFGLHLVELTAREEARVPRLEEVRAAVERDLLHERTEAANTAFYDRLRANYAVRVEDDGARASAPAG